MEQPDNIKTLLNAGAAAVQPVIAHGGIPFVAVPEGYAVRDLESLLPTPARKRADVTTTDTDSFIFYTKKHGSLDNCTIYADIDPEASRFNLVGVINDHGADVNAPQWRDHRCQFQPAQAVEWKRWLGGNKKQYSQADFATWLEDNLPDIASVAGTPAAPTPEAAVALFRDYLAQQPELSEAARDELNGKVLVCWCRPGQPCHADVLLEAANQKQEASR